MSYFLHPSPTHVTRLLLSFFLLFPCQLFLICENLRSNQQIISTLDLDENFDIKVGFFSFFFFKVNFLKKKMLLKDYCLKQIIKKIRDFLLYWIYFILVLNTFFKKASLYIFFPQKISLNFLWIPIFFFTLNYIFVKWYLPKVHLKSIYAIGRYAPSLDFPIKGKKKKGPCVIK